MGVLAKIKSIVTSNYKGLIALATVMGFMFHAYLNRYLGEIEKDAYFIGEFIMYGLLFTLLSFKENGYYTQNAYEVLAGTAWAWVWFQMFYTYKETQIDVLVQWGTFLLILALQIKQMWKMKRKIDSKIG